VPQHGARPAQSGRTSPWAQAFAPPPETEAVPYSESEDDYFDECAYAENNPGWDEKPLEDTIAARSDERMPANAGEMLRYGHTMRPVSATYASMRRLIRTTWTSPRIICPEDLNFDGPKPESKPKSPK